MLYTLLQGMAEGMLGDPKLEVADVAVRHAVGDAQGGAGQHSRLRHRAPASWTPPASHRAPGARPAAGAPLRQVRNALHVQTHYASFLHVHIYRLPDTQIAGDDCFGGCKYSASCGCVSLCLTAVCRTLGSGLTGSDRLTQQLVSCTYPADLAAAGAGLHAAVLGLRAAAGTAPYTVPPWLPGVLSASGGRRLRAPAHRQGG